MFLIIISGPAAFNSFRQSKLVYFLLSVTFTGWTNAPACYVIFRTSQGLLLFTNGPLKSFQVTNAPAYYAGASERKTNSFTKMIWGSLHTFPGKEKLIIVSDIHFIPFHAFQ
jgi:hypothetical protein